MPMEIGMDVASLEFGGGLRSALDRRRQRLAEPISPELALVCPETRALALELLPQRDPDGFLPQRRVTR